MGAPQYEQAGADVAGSGTTNTIPRWTGPTTLGDSGLIDNGTAIYTTTRNVGIGTASPSTRLHVLASAAPIATFASSLATQGYIQLNYNTSTTFGYIGNGASVISGGAAGDLGIRSDTGVISFATGGNTERARIDSAGNFGIGTPSPWSKISAVTANGADTVSVGFSFDSANNYRSGISTNWSSAAASQNLMGFLVSNATPTGFTRVMTLNGAGQAAIGTSSFTSGCSLTVAQSIDVSQSAQGLKLPATPGNADTQTLDCYQEGTWTPTLTAFDGTAPTATTARYTRIGRVVYFEVVLSATGAANFGSTWGNTKVSLPFAPANTIAIPINRNAIGSCGTTSGSDILLTTYAQNAETMRLTGFFSV